ncbi:plasmid mobilization relaxosome protein MobC [Gordonia amicalis]|uniref:plasmid mobilization relaxosome protein MobC n=1 Tax=Gordonia amicalis TaxID=89053 RepID=UPI0022A7480E|nr:plasmid mobilization relaxosome protein MobC [Gordonia amicalis]MCZ0914108.1 plasmid mobilization relaxosome protein MobC [Gordonia amicalis]
MAAGDGVATATAVVAAVPARKPRPITKESPIAFRPRPGTRGRLEKRAGQRSLSVVVELAVDAYLGRKVVDVDPSLRAALAAELSEVGDRLASIEHDERGVGRNLNQIARFLNTYREIPLGLAQELREANKIHERVLTELAAIRGALDRLVAAHEAVA